MGSLTGDYVYREPFLAICDNLKDALGLLTELKTKVASKNTTLDMEMDKLQNILTPTQRAKVRRSFRLGWVVVL
jgi:hypothetical protein